jgi:hypothetical protein
MAQVMKPKDQKFTKPVLKGDSEDEPPVSPPYIPSVLQPSKQQMPPLPDSPPTFSESPSAPSAASQPQQCPTPIPGLESKSTSPELPLHSSQALAPQARALQMLFHETQGPQQISADGTVQPRQSILYYQPFSTTDLLNWRNHTLMYSEKPHAMINLLESIFQTHQPTWDDC